MAIQPKPAVVYFLLGYLSISQVALGQSMAVDTLALFDTTRHRAVPVVLYQPAKLPKRPKIAVISHGYGGHSTDYSFIAHDLVAQGYVVAGVQHELPGDDPIPTTGNPRVVRRPNWERGVQNIRFVLASLNRRLPLLDRSRLLLVGHSNGGDQSMLYAHTYPAEVAAVITFDNRRMPLLRARQPRILSIRSSDQPADEGVLPTTDEQRTYGIMIEPQAILHNDMWDGATEAQKARILAAIRRFLRRR
ncbi:serine aminopeptidase domain-containing protein [Fibrella sp. WM1]|uniref:serine aminopeptidase domain-containing protein n=1 Tax=Fibrella musci TaxID=3242485 RepID=UPI003520F8D4